MTDIDLDALELNELKALRKKVEKAIDGFQMRKKQDALAAAEAAANEAGYSLSELLGTKLKTSGKGTINPPKYRHPENPQLTWTGRGRQPAWIKEAVEQGQDLETYLI